MIDGDGNIALVRAASAAGVEHFVLLSVTQASPGHPMELMRSKFAAEQELKATGLSWTIIRPALYMETWLRVAADPLVETGRTRVFGRGDNPLNLIAVHDVAQFVELALGDPGLRGATLEIGGPDNLSMNELLATVERVTGRTGRIDHVPVPALRLMSVLLRPVRPGLAGMIGAAVVMDTRDMRFDGSATARRFPSITATSLEAVARERYAPDGQASRTTAGQASPA